MREECRFRQRDLADALGVAQSFVSKYESGERELKGWEILRICDALSIPAVAFFGRVDTELRRLRAHGAASRVKRP